MILYRVRDWDRHFENNRTRNLAHMAWVRMPNKMDGDGYTLLVTHRHGAAHLGAWTAIVEIASKCKPRGTLVRDDGTPHDPGSLSRLSRLPASVFEEVLPRLASQDLGWLEVLTEPTDSTTAQASAAQPHPPAASPHGIDYGMERNGNERNGTEEKRTESLPKRAGGRSLPPTEEEVRGYWEERGLKGDPMEFLDYFRGNGWKTRAGPVVDWQARARNWSRNEIKKQGGDRESRIMLNLGR